MNAVKLLKRLSSQGVKVGFANNKLVIKAEKGCMTSEIMSQLKANKEVLHNFFIATGEAKESSRANITLAPVMKDYPLSPAQRRLWLAEQMHGNSSTYHMPLVARISGVLDVLRLQKAIECVIKKHEILRTTYKEVNGKVSQTVDEKVIFTLPFKLFTLGEKQLIEQVKQWVEAPFELASQWPIRMALWQIKENSYVLLGCVHHIACDGWSLGLLQKDLAEAYNLQGPLKPLSIQYKDYAVWCQNQSQPQKLEKFWCQYLKRIPAVHQLPTINTTKGRLDVIGAKYVQEIEDTLSSNIQEVCLSLNITPFVFYRSVFALLISRFSRQDDILLGSPEAGREIGSVESLIGFFVNTLVFRHQFHNTELSVKDWLVSEQDLTLNVLENKLLPFDLLPSLLGISRDNRHHPIFQIMFSMQNTPSSSVEFDGFSISPFQGEHSVAKFDITLDIVKGRSGHFSHWEYNKAIFPETFIKVMSEAYQYLLSTICMGLDLSLAEIGTMPYSPIETAQLSNNNVSFVSRIFSQPSCDVAFIDQAGMTTYGELASKVASIYDQLSTVKKQSSIAIWQDRNADYVASILAIWCAGHTAVPLDKSLVDSRLQYILNDAKVSVVIGDEPLSILPTYHIDVNKLQNSDSTPWVNSLSLLGNFLIYTSGSTGKAKGVKVTCSSLEQHLSSLSSVFPNLAKQSVLHFTSFSVDTALEQLFMGLMQGAKVIVKPDEVWDCSTFWNQVAEYQVTSVDLPPSYLVTMIAEEGSGASFLQSSLKHIVLGGESFPDVVVEFWHQHCLWEKIQLWNAYGPTEATITATLKQVKKSTLQISLGKLLPGRKALVVDHVGQPLPSSVSGELLLGGIGLAEGYINNLAQTDSRFIYIENERFYRTGDIVSCDAENEFHFKGREDNQVKVRGYRVELEEVESTVQSIEGVDQAVVILKNRGKPNAYLVAYYSGVTSENSLMRNQLSLSLPHYMVPKYFQFMTNWPLLPNGKIDRQFLLSTQLKLEDKTLAGEAKLPQNSKQEILAKVWQSVLQVSSIDITESFFSAGGDSISAIKLVGELARVGWKITAKDIFVEHSIEGISQKMVMLGEDISYESVTGESPLLPIQRSFLNEQNEYWLHFNQVVGIKLYDPIDEEKLWSIIKVLAGQHDVLRMEVTQKYGEVSTTINDKLTSKEVALHHYTIDSFASKEWLSIVNQHQSIFLTKPNILWQLLLVDNRFDEQQYLVWICHHFIIDAVSWQVLLRDFDLAIQSNQIESTVLPAKTAPIPLWHERLLGWGEKLGSETLTYWQNQVTAFESASFSMLEEESIASTQLISDLIPIQTISAYLEVGRQKLAMTEQELLLALFSQALGKALKIDNIAFVMENQGRLAHKDLPDISRTLGWFTATYPFVCHLSREPILDLVQLKDAFRIVPDQGLSFSVLQQLFPEKVSLDWQTYTAICFNFLGKSHHGKNEASFSPAQIPLGNHQHPLLKRSFAMAINCSLTKEGLQYAIDYGESAFERKIITQLRHEVSQIATQLTSALDDIAEQKTLSDFPLVNITPSTFEGVLDKFGDVEALYPSTPMQHGMVYHALMDNVDVYVPQSHLRFTGSFNTSLFVDAWQQLIKKYQVLRSCFYLDDEQVLHIILPTSEVPISIMPLEQIPGDINAYKTAVAREGFDLTRAPLMRLDIIKQGDIYDVIWTHHHSILDGWSIPIIFNELMSWYTALLNGEKINVNSACHYERYISWVLEQDKVQAMDYWHKNLIKLENKTDLGFEVQATKPELDYITQDLKCSEALTLQLSDYAKKHNVTLNTLIQASWAWLIAKYSGEDVVCYGTTVSGRPNDVTNSQSMVGLFINSLPVVTEVDAYMLISDWLQDLQLTLSTCEQYSYLPLTDIASAVNKRGSDLFDTLFIFENYPKGIEGSEANDDATIRISKQPTKEQTNYPLTIMVAESKQLHIRLVLDGKKQRAKWLSQVRSQWLSLLSGIVSKSWQRVGQWTITPPAFEPHEIDFSAQSLQKIFKRQSELNTDSVIICGSETFTYRDIFEMANRLSGYLSKRGVNRVGLFLQRSEKLLSSILGCLISGTTFVPLDPAFPKDRLKVITQEAELDLVVTDCDKQIIFDECESISFGLIPNENIVIDLFETSFSAYIMFTSGSTGKPKGVEISIDALSLFLAAAQNELCVKSSEHFLATTTYAFDISLLELLLPIMQGASLTIATSEEYRDPDKLISLITDNREINVLQGTPSFWRMLFSVGWTGPLVGQLILCGGEELTPELAKRLIQHDATVYNCYGPTEATVWSMMSKVTGENKVRLSGSLQGYQHLVLDNLNHIVLPGMIGELCIASSALAEGYWNNEELSNEKFFVHPKVKQRLYRTGDLVRFIEHDCFEYLGRIDEQVKVRGFRIELGEINAALELMDGVSEACTQVRLIDTESQIVAYIVTTKSISHDMILRELHNCLPHYMVPQFIEELSKLPKNNNGKVDKRKLPEPSIIKNQRVLTAPQNARQQNLFTVWKQVLKRDDISIDETFSFLGGNSLQLVSLLAKIRKNIDENVQLQQLSGPLTIRLLDDRLRQVRKPMGVFDPLISLQHDKNLYLLPPISGFWENTEIFSSITTSIFNVIGIQLGGLLVELNESQILELIAEQIINEDKDDIYIGAYSLGGIWVTSLIEAIELKGGKVKAVVLLDCGHKSLMEVQSVQELTKNVLSIVDSVLEDEHLSIVNAIGQCRTVQEVESLNHNNLNTLDKELFTRLLAILKHNELIGSDLKQHEGVNIPAYYLAPCSTGNNDIHIQSWEKSFPLLVRLDVNGDHKSMLQAPNSQSLFLQLEKEIIL